MTVQNQIEEHRGAANYLMEPTMPFDRPGTGPLCSLPGTSCLATIERSLRDKDYSPIEAPRTGHLNDRLTALDFWLLSWLAQQSACRFQAMFRIRSGNALYLPTSDRPGR